VTITLAANGFQKYTLKPSSLADLPAALFGVEATDFPGLHFRSCSRDVRSVGPCRISPSAPKKAAQNYCAQLTATGITVVASIAGRHRAYCYPCRGLARRKDEAGLPDHAALVSAFATNKSAGRVLIADSTVGNHKSPLDWDARIRVNVVILRRKRMDSRHCRLMTASLAPVNPSNRRKVTGSMQGVICPMVRLSDYLPLFCQLQGNLTGARGAGCR
jgi:hypothetical protein